MTCVCWSRVLTVLRVVHEGVAPGLLIAEARLEAKLRVGCVHGGCCWGWCTRGHSNGGAVAIATWQQRVSTLLYLFIWGWDNSVHLSLNMFHQIWLTWNRTHTYYRTVTVTVRGPVRLHCWSCSVLLQSQQKQSISSNLSGSTELRLFCVRVTTCEISLVPSPRGAVKLTPRVNNSDLVTLKISLFLNQKSFILVFSPSDHNYPGERREAYLLSCPKNRWRRNPLGSCHNGVRFSLCEK